MRKKLKDFVGKNPWDEAVKREVVRTAPRPYFGKDGKVVDPAPEVLDKGVNYFIEKFEQLGIETLFSCEGHPDNFHVVFKTAKHKLVRKIAALGGFCIDLLPEDNLYRLILDAGKLHVDPHLGLFDILDYGADLGITNVSGIELEAAQKNKTLPCSKEDFLRIMSVGWEISLPSK